MSLVGKKLDLTSLPPQLAYHAQGVASCSMEDSTLETTWAAARKWKGKTA